MKYKMFLYAIYGICCISSIALFVSILMLIWGDTDDLSVKLIVTLLLFTSAFAILGSYLEEYLRRNKR